ncbi:MAG: hypothetical protein QM737_18445 [Ferruginibacter sp.]
MTFCFFFVKKKEGRELTVLMTLNVNADHEVDRSEGRTAPNMVLAKYGRTEVSSSLNHYQAFVMGKQFV